jgi:hypothetical protein
MPPDEHECPTPIGDKGNTAEQLKRAEVHEQEAHRTQDNLKRQRLKNGAVILCGNRQPCHREVHVVERRKLSHRRLATRTAIAELQAPTAVGSGDLLGSNSCDITQKTLHLLSAERSLRNGNCDIPIIKKQENIIAGLRP